MRTFENIAAVRASIEYSPTRFARKRASALEIWPRILYTDFKLHPHKIIMAQELSPVDWERRRDCCNAILTSVPSQ